jgi:hypothetical protein
MIRSVREEDSYVDIYHNFMSHLPFVIATVLFMWTIWMKNLENLIFFFPKDTFTCEIVNILFARVFWYIDSPTKLQRYYRYFTHNT